MDRNEFLATLGKLRRKSLSARRAWIEMGDMELSEASKAVALRKESVDRNDNTSITAYNIIVSLSARRAWIEMLSHGLYSLVTIVALRKESVDRNTHYIANNKLFQGRSPQGERG